jgi:Tol biopolymer transport system component/DNA-binding winged helix-turn-helix (wHTH) protein
VSVRFYTFDRFRVDSVKRLLFRDDVVVPLTPKAFDILLLLLQRRGGVVEKEDILREIWHGTAVEENNLARNISTLRKVLEDVPGENRFIATISGRGYQFVADVEEAAASPPDRLTAPPPTPAVDVPPAPAPAAAPSVPMGRRVLAAALIIIAVAVADYAIRAEWPRGSAPSTAPEQIWQLTFASGLQGEPSWSPDGRMVAFSSDRSGNLDIWIQSVDGGNPIQVSTSPAHDWQPDWSPDGSRLVFRSERDGGGLYVVPALGGPEQQIAPFGYHARWSPDGTQILFHRSNFEGRALGSREIYTVGLDGRPPRKVLSAFLNEFGSFSTAWHPDSKRISIWGAHLTDGLSFWTAPLDGTSAPVKSDVPQSVRQRLSDAAVRFTDPDGAPLSFLWSPSGNALYFEGLSRGVQNIWKMDVDASNLQWRGGPQRLTTGAEPNAGLSVTRDGRKLAFAVRTDRVRLWSFAVDEASGGVADAGEPITAAAFDALSPVLSRDGTQLIFEVERGGAQEIWRKSIADDRDTLLVPGDRFRRISPVWSYDNSRVMYLRTAATSGDAGGGEIVTVPAAGGQEQVLRTPARVQRLFDWSVDGAWILAAGPRRDGSPYELALFPANGASGGARRVLAVDEHSNLWKARFSTDQRWVAFTTPTGPGASAVYAVRASGGARVEITSGEFFDDRPRWSSDARLVYFLSSRSGFFNVWARRFDPDRGVPVGEPFEVTHFNGPAQMIPARMVQLGMAISRDRLIIPIAAASGNIWVLDGLTP